MIGDNLLIVDRQILRLITNNYYYFYSPLAYIKMIPQYCDHSCFAEKLCHPRSFVIVVYVPWSYCAVFFLQNIMDRELAARKKAVIWDDEANYDVEMLLKLEEMEQYCFLRHCALLHIIFYIHSICRWYDVFSLTQWYNRVTYTTTARPVLKGMARLVL